LSNDRRVSSWNVHGDLPATIRFITCCSKSAPASVLNTGPLFCASLRVLRINIVNRIYRLEVSSAERYRLYTVPQNSPSGWELTHYRSERARHAGIRVNPFQERTGRSESGAQPHYSTVEPEGAPRGARRRPDGTCEAQAWYITVLKEKDPAPIKFNSRREYTRRHTWQCRVHDASPPAA
jgi:hypothetical protein